MVSDTGISETEREIDLGQFFFSSFGNSQKKQAELFHDRTEDSPPPLIVTEKTPEGSRMIPNEHFSKEKWHQLYTHLLADTSYAQIMARPKFKWVGSGIRESFLNAVAKTSETSSPVLALVNV